VLDSTLKLKRRRNRITEREAVNAARRFFESNGCVFQEVDTANDYGKDAYLDIAEGEQITGLCAAIQVKGGVSYRRPDGSYFIPVDVAHIRIWQQSTLPVLGLVYDPDDGLIRWCSISAFVNTKQNARASSIPVVANAVLDEKELHTSLRSAVLEASRVVKDPLVQTLSEESDISESAILDCFALGRSDARVLLGLRYLLRAFDREVMRSLIYVLTHLTPHPDIFWHERNWIPKEIKQAVQPHLYWEQAEILRLLQAVDADEYQRGGMGQSLYMLLVQDSNITEKMASVAVRAASSGDEEIGNIALYLHLYWLGEDAPERFSNLLSAHASLRSLSNVPEIAQQLEDHGYLAMF
jgi:hypothetical protein